jgi:hypothetical protein
VNFAGRAPCLDHASSSAGPRARPRPLYTCVDLLVRGDPHARARLFEHLVMTTAGVGVRSGRVGLEALACKSGTSARLAYVMASPQTWDTPTKAGNFPAGGGVSEGEVIKMAALPSASPCKQDTFGRPQYQ